MQTLPRNLGPRATIGVPYKLVSSRGTLLGILTVPDYLADLLHERGGVQFSVYKTETSHQNKRPPALSLSIGTLARHLGWTTGDAVQLSGVSLEDIEMQPGFTFAPSAGYLRGLIE